MNLKLCVKEYGESLCFYLNQELLLGIRFEVICINGKNTGLTAKIIALEKLGHENLIYIQFKDKAIQIHSGDTLVARVKQDVQFDVGAEVNVIFDETQLHLFSENGQRLSK